MANRIKDLETTATPQEDPAKAKKTSMKLRNLREENKQLATVAKQLQLSLVDAERDFDGLESKYKALLLTASEYEERTRTLASCNRVLIEHLQEVVEG